MLRARSPKRRRRPGETPATDRLRLVVGLRNPGPEYERSRHNAGYMVVSRVLERAGVNPGRGPSRVRATVAVAGAGQDRVIYAVPTTYMNESGQAVRSVLDYYGLSPQDLLVVHDDIDLAFGRLRLQVGGGSGGNNGVRSIERALGTNEFNRLKFGVGRPPGGMDPADFVLRPFSAAERAEVEQMIEDAADVVQAWSDDAARAQEMAALRGRDPDS